MTVTSGARPPAGTDTGRDRTPTALALNCTLQRSPAASSTQRMIDEILAELRTEGIDGDTVRVVDHDVLPGVSADEGEGDAWPALRARVMAADVLVLATPTWLGHPSSVCQRVLERLDAELSETDDAGRPPTFDKVAIIASVGNEDGAHKIIADLSQALTDIGFTVPAQGSVYWNGEAMQGSDYRDLEQIPDPVRSTQRTAAANAAHLVRVLAARPYPGPEPGTDHEENS